MDREAWRAAIDGVAKSRTRLSDWTELKFWTSYTLSSNCKPESGTERERKKGHALYNYSFPLLHTGMVKKRYTRNTGSDVFKEGTLLKFLRTHPTVDILQFPKFESKIWYCHRNRMLPSVLSVVISDTYFLKYFVVKSNFWLDSLKS